MAIGSPDWQRYPARVGDNLFGAQALTIPAIGATYGPYAVSSWGGLSLGVAVTAGYVNVTVKWWETSSMVTMVKSDEWTLNTTVSLHVTMPVWAPYVSVEFSGPYTGDVSATGTLRGLASAGPGFAYPVSAGNLDHEAVSLAASGSVIYQSPYIRSGQWYVTYNPYDANGKMAVSVVAVNPDGTATSTLSDLGVPVSISHWLLPVPPVAMGIQVVNNDSAASHEFDLQVMFG